MGLYLLTGAAGFIGSHVAHLLLDNDHQVVGIDNLNDAYDVGMKMWRLNLLTQRKGFSFARSDISDLGSLSAVWDENQFDAHPFDAVINLAARAGVRQSVKNPWVYFETNVTGTLNLLKLCNDRGVQKFVQASTSSLYGAHNSGPFSEEADTSRPLSPYAASKGASEMICHSFHYLHGIDITILRYFTVFGPAGRPDMSIFRFIQWVAEKRPVLIYGDGEQERDFTYVGDIARGTVAALKSVGYEVINLGSDTPYRLMDILRKIELLLGMKADIEWHETAPADVRSTWASIDKAGSLLGWEPQVSMDEGLAACVDWYEKERDWASQINTSDD
jgi:nucleoside-diphosphate-sugar epimerase